MTETVVLGGKMMIKWGVYGEEDNDTYGVTHKADNTKIEMGDITEYLEIENVDVYH